MASRLVLLGGALLMGLWAAGCDDGETIRPPDAGTTVDSGTGASDSGTVDAGDGGGGGGRSDFTCNVVKQDGCAAGQNCLYTDLTDGGTGSRCFPGACDPVRQQDCPAGQRCTYVARDGGDTQRQCVAAGTGTEGAPCTLASDAPAGQRYDTCGAGLYCKDDALNDGGTGFFCRELCHATSDCASGDCNTVLRLAGTDELPLVCGPPSARCDAFAQDCEGPLGCYPATNGPVCAGRGTLAPGAACEFSNQCSPGSTCAVSDGVGTCRTLCRVPSGSPACSSGTCRALTNNGDVGACVP
ncbi:hypothetical protein D7Y13_09175 [Corallococcus praedator]|uniref:Lipoprotein n=1 Tax=Corallococcus praedator TaxID=2316724 RepID=A0ABX9QNM9_9BACT|nr:MULTISPECIES: hypothetical protein [Corallococcus]RKH17930.1 hypothetical protein D7X74_11080 [Corallococcus sp. CA047B]RKH36303.1 hypothetical protein D7X75_01470 [Corallococcus sp. CA031C]RKI12552.1 hypothetical protein D7Y13_09175 [Corallococcus praedator]